MLFKNNNDYLSENMLSVIKDDERDYSERNTLSGSLEKSDEIVRKQKNFFEEGKNKILKKIGDNIGKILLVIYYLIVFTAYFECFTFENVEYVGYAALFLLAVIASCLHIGVIYELVQELSHHFNIIATIILCMHSSSLLQVIASIPLVYTYDAIACQIFGFFHIYSGLLLMLFTTYLQVTFYYKVKSNGNESGKYTYQNLERYSNRIIFFIFLFACMLLYPATTSSFGNSGGWCSFAPDQWISKIYAYVFYGLIFVLIIGCIVLSFWINKGLSLPDIQNDVDKDKKTDMEANERLDAADHNAQGQDKQKDQLLFWLIGTYVLITILIFAPRLLARVGNEVPGFPFPFALRVSLESFISIGAICYSSVFYNNKGMIMDKFGSFIKVPSSRKMSIDEDKSKPYQSEENLEKLDKPKEPAYLYYGIHVSHLEKFLVDHREKIGDDTTTEKVAEDIIKKLVVGEHKTYCSYILNTNNDTTDVKEAQIFISHCWQYPFAKLVDVIRASGYKYVWIDVFSSDKLHSFGNTKQTPEEKKKASKEFIELFDNVIPKIGKVGIVCLDWKEPNPKKCFFHRAWCLYELFLCRKYKGEIEILSPSWTSWIVAPHIIRFLKTENCDAKEDLPMLTRRLLEFAKELCKTNEEKENLTERELFNKIDIEILKALRFWWLRDCFPHLFAYIFYCLGFYDPIIAVIPLGMILIIVFITFWSEWAKKYPNRFEFQCEIFSICGIPKFSVPGRVTISPAGRRIIKRLLLFFFFGFLPAIAAFIISPKFHKNLFVYEVDFGLSGSMKAAINETLIILIFILVVRILAWLAFLIFFNFVIHSRINLKNPN